MKKHCLTTVLAMSAPYFYATKVLSLQIDAVIAPWDWNWQKREQFAGNTCSWVVLAVRKKEEARSKNLRESQKSDVLTSWCFLLKLMSCCVAWMVKGWKKNSTKFRTKGDLKLKFCKKQKTKNTNLWTYSHPFNSKATNKTGGHPSNLLYICIVWFP